MSTMERILRLMSEKKASDVYLSANAPALIKINGECVPINNQILPPDATRNLLSEIVPPDRIEELEETGELNMGVPLSGVGRFRVSAMRQRGSYAVVIRFISQVIPDLADLSLRAVHVLSLMDLVACEDTRVSGGLLRLLGLDKRLLPLHEHNESEAAQEDGSPDK